VTAAPELRSLSDEELRSLSDEELLDHFREVTEMLLSKLAERSDVSTPSKGGS
jgi:ligand-binding sensor protein